MPINITININIMDITPKNISITNMPININTYLQFFRTAPPYFNNINISTICTPTYRDFQFCF